MLLTQHEVNNGHCIFLLNNLNIQHMICVALNLMRFVQTVKEVLPMFNKYLILLSITNLFSQKHLHCDT